MIGDFIHRGKRGRAVSIEGLTSHRTPKNLCERDALPTELYPHDGMQASTAKKFVQQATSPPPLAGRVSAKCENRPEEKVLHRRWCLRNHA
jgi:hypothetical protein